MTSLPIEVILHPNMSQLSLFAPLQPSTWSVTDLTRYLRDLLESDEFLQDVWVQGEISNFSRPASGHLYFTLKDSGASLRCVMWRNSVIRQQFLPRDGEAVEAHGAISIYEAGGQYQLYADLLRPAGEGALFQEFLRIKALLETEGLFDPARKRPLPRWPRRIGIVTSPTGAALRDMLNTLRRRYPLAEVTLAPTPVQGVEAPAGIIAALQAINRLTHPDVILLARGGGSVEDLWAFNDESVARAIAASQAPVITGVGHETDFTIADFVADLRAPTPTAAAELATPNLADLRLTLDDYAGRIARLAQTVVSAQRWVLSAQGSRLALHSPHAALQAGLQRLQTLQQRTSAALLHSLQMRQARLQGVTSRLEALNPSSILKRGFALIADEQGTVISSVRQISTGEHLDVHVYDGDFGVRVENIPTPPEE